MNTQTGNRHLSGSDAFGQAVARRLTEGSEDLPHDISERLKVARAQAVTKRKIASVQVAGAISMTGGEAALQFGTHEDGWWSKIASVLPLLALVAGLISIAVLQDEVRTREVAEVDAELLTDDLPPSAFTDPGFAQYLRVNQAH
jgi:hypothetical protein